MTKEPASAPPNSGSIHRTPEPVFLQTLARALPPGRVLAGLPDGAAAYALSRLLQPEDPLDAPALTLPLLVALPAQDDAERFADELRFHLQVAGPTVPIAVRLFPADDVRTFDGTSPHPDLPRSRLLALHALLNASPAVVVASARALMHRVLPPEVLIEHVRTLRPGDIVERDALVRDLQQAGYLTAATVEEPGTLSVRGGTLDLWPAGAEAPVRISFFDDEIEELRPLDPEQRRHTARLPALEVLPSRETIVTPAALVRAAEQTALAVDRLGGGYATRRRVLAELREGLWFPGAEDYLPALHALVDPLSYVPPECRVVIDLDSITIEARRFGEVVAARWDSLPVEERPMVLPELRYLPARTLLAGLAPALRLETFVPEAPDHGARDNADLRVTQGDLQPVVARLRGWLEDGWQVALVCESHARAERVLALLGPHGLRPTPPPPGLGGSLPPGRLSLLIGYLPRGFRAEHSQLVYVTADELFGARERAPRVPRRLVEAVLSSFTDLKAGDLVVHTRQGIGRFLGLKRINAAGRPEDFAELEYRDGDRMYLPVTRLDQLYRYRAMGEATPRLDKLGGETWERRKQRVTDKVLAMAAELLELHAHRTLAAGYPYRGTPPAFQLFVEAFPYVETPDQQTAIDEVLADLAAPEAMERLIVGDVGFGKTEVAMRAAMRVVLEGHQVAVLCPTTVLAFQHHQTFLERFAGTGVRIELLSRFRSEAQTRDTLAHVREGTVNILIGTSALLGRRLRFQHLGLIVIDEEHRFGVRQKERLKKLAQGQEAAVEYLAMSATPIPRTLHMALSGLRKISLIATPPAGRSAILTHVIKHDEQRIREHVLHEIKRGGQVFYLHNRVQSIEQTANDLQRLLPEVRLSVAHGQLGEDDLERTLVRFVRRESDLLVTTTIIESGVDLPNVNTMIIERADQLGLAQLYQLRGRVGRGARRGYCILTVPTDGFLSRDAMQRLRVLQENTELGAGFAIASADLELRGSGNLLGQAQHGNIQAVGLDTYVELLEEAAATARGEMTRRRLDPEIDVPVTALLPEDYIEDVEERLHEYRRIATARAPAEVRALIDEWESRYGEPPAEVLNLGWSAETRLRCRELGIDRVSWMRVRVALRFHPSTRLPPARLLALATEQPRRFSLAEEAGATTLIARFTPPEAEWPFRFLHWVLRQIEKDPES